MSNGSSEPGRPGQASARQPGRDRQWVRSWSPDPDVPLCCRSAPGLADRADRLERRRAARSGGWSPGAGLLGVPDEADEVHEHAQEHTGRDVAEEIQKPDSTSQMMLSSVRMRSIRHPPPPGASRVTGPAPRAEVGALMDLMRTLLNIIWLVLSGF